jgi:diaminopimelate decarboxylase
MESQRRGGGSMTLFEILPSLRHFAPRIDRAIWPLTAHADELGRLCVGEVPLTDVADEFGTPTYVIDEADFRDRIRQFGLPAQYGPAARAVERIVGHPLLYLVGLHCHIGSQVTDSSLYGEVIRQLVPLMAEIRERHAVILTELNIGGGHGVPYVPGDEELDLDALRDFIDDALDASCAAEHFPRPAIMVEPGRAISVRAGVTLYRVLQVRSQPGGRTSVVVDGGVSDNPRVALYDARYSVALANRHPLTATQPMTVVGRHGESGDKIARDVPLPADLRAGDLLAVACTGAYHHSMASTYTMVGRPPLVAVKDGSTRELVRRETTADILSRDRACALYGR